MGADEPRSILLASSSPRRRQLLIEAGLPFVLIEPGPETPAPPEVGPAERAMRHARSKARGADVAGRTGLLLAVDTVVAVDGRSLGKPRDRDEAAEFLDLVCGREHEVFSAHALGPVAAGVRLAGEEELVARAVVAVADLDDVARRRYLDSGDWRDKAGGYGIQSLAGAFARLVEGELDTVVGLTRSVVGGAWERYSR